MRMRRRNVPLVLLLAFLLVFGGVAAYKAIPSGDGTGGLASCATRTSIVVASSTEKSALLTELADEYNGTSGRCGKVTVTPVTSGAAAKGFANGWDESVDGPFPDVWSPAASAWVGLARSQGNGPALLPESGPPIAQSRLVFAVPESVGRTFSWPNASLGWSDVATFATDPAARAQRGLPGAFTLGKTSPTESTSGLFSLLGAIGAAPGAADDPLERAVTDPSALAFEKQVESTVVHYGNTEQEFLENFAAAAARTGDASDYVDAVAVEEKSIFDYNRGNPAGAVPAPSAPPPPGGRLLGLPIRDGTYVSDSPYLVVNGPETSAAKRTAADDFRGWLLEPDRQRAFRQNGFRDAQGVAGDELRASGAIAAREVSPLPPPAPAAVVGALAAWPQLRKAANIVVVMDRSGSMTEPAQPRRPESRWDAAKSAAARALAQLTDQDALSLWTFSTARAGEGAPYRVDVPPGPAAATLPQVSQALNAITPQGGTALYETTQAAVDSVRRSYDPNRINAVVLLTDGRNEDTAQLDPGPLFAELPGGEATGRPPVRVFSIAYAGESDFPTLQEMGRASGGYAYNATNPADLDKVFGALIANF